jgi:hypothetical protein
MKALAPEIMHVLAPVLVAIAYIGACSFFREPNRRNFNAIMLAGAGAAYLNGGFGAWEFVFTAAVTYCAYRGLHSYNLIGIGVVISYRLGHPASPVRKSHRPLRSELLVGMRHL